MIKIRTNKRIDHVIRDGKGRILEDTKQRRKITTAHVTRIMEDAGGVLAWVMDPGSFESASASVVTLECWLIKGRPLIVQYYPNGGAELYESIEGTDWPSIAVRIAKLNESFVPMQWISTVGGWSCSKCGETVRELYKKPHGCE